MTGSNVVMIGTNKGAFTFASDASRKNWTLAGPHLGGWEVSALHVHSHNGKPRLLVGTTHFVYGATIRISDDMGQTFREIEASPKYASDSGRALKRIWQIAPGHASEPRTLFAGVDEAGIFVSRDGGETWTEMSGLTKGRNTKDWFPGNGGLCLHTILVDPNDKMRMWVAISAVGCFRTTDGGETWTECNKNLPTMPTGVEGTPECCCVHKVVIDPRNSDTLYMQFHGGVFKSTNAAESWQKIENGLPGNFGFPIVITKRGDLFIAPLQADEQRYFKDGKFQVYKSTDQGATWAPRSKGIPAEARFAGVLRDAMSVDSHEPAGIFVGTTMGEVFFSNDAGESWSRMPAQLPRIETVRACLL
ncbi:MAG: exo-alpha-sialidase [Tepidisphaeraceae bacterium]